MAAAWRHRRNSNIAVSSKYEQQHVQGQEVFALGKKTFLPQTKPSWQKKFFFPIAGKTSQPKLFFQLKTKPGIVF